MRSLAAAVPALPPGSATGAAGDAQGAGDSRLANAVSLALLNVLRPLADSEPGPGSRRTGVCRRHWPGRVLGPPGLFASVVLSAGSGTADAGAVRRLLGRGRVQMARGRCAVAVVNGSWHSARSGAKGGGVRPILRYFPRAAPPPAVPRRSRRPAPTPASPDRIERGCLQHGVADVAAGEDAVAGKLAASAASGRVLGDATKRRRRSFALGGGKSMITSKRRVKAPERCGCDCCSSARRCLGCSMRAEEVGEHVK